MTLYANTTLVPKVYSCDLHKFHLPLLPEFVKGYCKDLYTTEIILTSNVSLCAQWNGERSDSTNYGAGCFEYRLNLCIAELRARWNAKDCEKHCVAEASFDVPLGIRGSGLAPDVSMTANLAITATNQTIPLKWLTITLKGFVKKRSVDAANVWKKEIREHRIDVDNCVFVDKCPTILTGFTLVHRSEKNTAPLTARLEIDGTLFGKFQTINDNEPRFAPSQHIRVDKPDGSNFLRYHGILRNSIFSKSATCVAFHFESPIPKNVVLVVYGYECRDNCGQIICDFD
jgi:hypothetical protein